MLKTFAPETLFAHNPKPQAPMAGLWLYFSCFEEAHNLADQCETTEGYLWHGIVHRLEGDTGNAAYWFRKAGKHSIHPDLALAATKILHRIRAAEFRLGHWDPYAFLGFCDRAAEQPGSDHELAAREIQRAEWQLLFDYCAREP